MVGGLWPIPTVPKTRAASEAEVGITLPLGADRDAYAGRRKGGAG